MTQTDGESSCLSRIVDLTDELQRSTTSEAANKSAAAAAQKQREAAIRQCEVAIKRACEQEGLVKALRAAEAKRLEEGGDAAPTVVAEVGGEARERERVALEAELLRLREDVQRLEEEAAVAAGRAEAEAKARQVAELDVAVEAKRGEELTAQLLALLKRRGEVPTGASEEAQNTEATTEIARVVREHTELSKPPSAVGPLRIVMEHESMRAAMEVLVAQLRESAEEVAALQSQLGVQTWMSRPHQRHDELPADVQESPDHDHAVWVGSAVTQLEPRGGVEAGPDSAELKTPTTINAEEKLAQQPPMIKSLEPAQMSSKDDDDALEKEDVEGPGEEKAEAGEYDEDVEGEEDEAGMLRQDCEDAWRIVEDLRDQNEALEARLVEEHRALMHVRQKTGEGRGTVTLLEDADDCIEMFWEVF